MDLTGWMASVASAVKRALYLAVNAAVAAQAVGQTGVDAGVTGQAGELVQAARLE